MRVLVLVFALLAVAASAQPVASSLEAARVTIGDAAPIVLRPLPAQEPSRALYWTGVAADGAVLAGGLAVGVWALATLADEPEAEEVFAYVVRTPFVALGGALGVSVAVLAGLDLAHVADGGDPFLARAFDPDRVRWSPAPR